MCALGPLTGEGAEFHVAAEGFLINMIVFCKMISVRCVLQLPYDLWETFRKHPRTEERYRLCFAAAANHFFLATGGLGAPGDGEGDLHDGLLRKPFPASWFTAVGSMLGFFIDWLMLFEIRGVRWCLLVTTALSSLACGTCRPRCFRCCFL